jgi:arabinose-5-phosphate isomerase
MSKEATRRRTAPTPAKLTPEEQLRAAREIVRREAAGVWKVSYRLNSSFCEAVKLLFTNKGSAIVTGIMLTQSGETAEVVQLLPSLREFGVPLVAITASHMSTIGQAATVVIELGELEEVCSLGLAPSTSTTAMLAVGDALALVLSKMRNFQADDFARFHPGGALGRRLSRVDDIMRPLAECRQASEALSVRQVIVACSRPGRRSGAIMLTSKSGRLTGLFTDSDLARLFERRDETALDRPIRDVMATKPTAVPSGTRVADAISLLAKRKFSELPVVDSAGRPIGLIDVTDVVGLAPSEADRRAPKKAA